MRRLSRRDIAFSTLAVVVLCHVLVPIVTAAYSSSPQHTPPLNRRVMAGLWRLTSSNKISILGSSGSNANAISNRRPMKEFTVRPKKLAAEQQQQQQVKEFLLMLKEDGSFQQYGEEDRKKKKKSSSNERSVFRRSTGWGASSSSDEDDDKQSPSTTTTTATAAPPQIQGTWDFVDGKLILAADRPADGQSTTKDTILVGRVVATHNQSLVENPAVLAASNATTSTTTTMDTHLSVPKGKVQVGKFAYPKKHPSFFDQPLFHPEKMGSFELRQVLGSLNTGAGYSNNEDDEDDLMLVEKFRRQDFYDKRFLLTSHPFNKPRGKMRWSIKYNQYVEDKPKRQDDDEDEDKQQSIPIRVMELMLFSNNTFATVKGLGDDAILRGKWDIIGKERDQFWMQVWRFGFGRSVSGSVYSEGRALSHNDAKSYWGTIGWLEPETDEEGEKGSDKIDPASSKTDSSDEKADNQQPRRLQVKGSVIYGWGLEPQPVARFLMTEAETAVEEDDEEEDDDDDDDLDWDNSFQ